MNSDDPWTIAFDAYDPETEQRREALFALGNGVVVIRGAATCARADARHYPGTYHAGGYARFEAKVADETVEVESLANLPNPLPLTFRIDGGAWFTIDGAELDEYRHALDLRAGMSLRELTCRWEGRRLRLVERRLVSMARPMVAAVHLRLVPLGWSGRVEVKAALDGAVENGNVDRYGPYPSRHFARPEATVDGKTGVVRTRLLGTGTEVETAQRLDPTGRSLTVGQSVEEHLVRDVRHDMSLDVCKRISVRHAIRPGRPEEEVASAPGFDALEREHRHAWGALWTAVGIDAEDTTVTRALRFHAFHVLQTVSPHSRELDSGIPARGWHGEAYRGHIFWDELFVFPFLLARFPDLARAKLLYRHRRLDAARAAARAAGHRGAMYPWRSASDGREVTPRWQWNMLSGRWMPDHTHRARHVGSAVAYNFWQHYLATGDVDFLASHGAEVILEVARFWASKAEYDPDDDRYDIRGVVGPDEFHTAYPGAASPGLDNNAYTNLTAVWTLCRALELPQYLPTETAAALRDRLGVTGAETALWERISRRMRLAFHDDGILSQFEGFERLASFRQGVLPPRFDGERLNWALEAVGDTANDYRMTKQADALMLFYLFPAEEVFTLMARLGYDFDLRALERTCRYYLDLTTHRSSLSRVVYAGALAEVDREASWRLFREALGTDLFELKSQSIAEGVHLGAMGGTLDLLQRRYFGLSPTPRGARLSPTLPEELGPMRLRVAFRGLEIEAEGCGRTVTLTARASNPEALEVECPGGVRFLEPGETLCCADGVMVESGALNIT